MFERFTDDARQVIVRAQAEARGLGHNFIGTEHILLGLLDEATSEAAEVLESLGLRYADAVEDVARIVGRSDKVEAGQIPFTPRAKKVLELSLREALALGHNYIGPEHVLLGLLRERKGVAAQILSEHEIADEAIRTGMLERLPLPGRRRRWFPSVGFYSARRWEYRVEHGLDPERLDELGAEGWELVGVVPRGEDVELVFKRPAQPRAAEERRSA